MLPCPVHLPKAAHLLFFELHLLFIFFEDAHKACMMLVSGRPPGWCACDLLVVARHTEPLGWLDNLTMPVHVVDKASTSNVGRESLSMLMWIIDNYDAMGHAGGGVGCVCFSQGSLRNRPRFLRPDDFEHAWLRSGVDFGPIVASGQARLSHSPCGGPNFQLPCLEPLRAAIVGAHRINTSGTFGGAFFIVRASAIARLPRQAYWYLVHEHFGSGCGLRIPWAMERLWQALFTCGSCSPTQRVRLPVRPSQRCRGLNGTMARQGGTLEDRAYNWHRFPPNPLANAGYRHVEGTAALIGETLERQHFR